MKEDWINLRISNIKTDVLKLCDELLEWGALSATVKGDEDKGNIDKAWFNEPGEPIFGNWKNKTITALFRTMDELDSTRKILENTYPDADLVYSFQVLENKDWVRHTQIIHNPIEVIPGFYILAPWHKKPREASGSIIIDPGLGFGTGSHPTTFLCLQWIMKNVEGGLSFLDYGCGSGILGTAAAKLGAEPVVAIDIDEQAVQATEHNANLNDVDIRCGLPELVSGLHFNTIVANILARPLISLSDKIINLLETGGTLIMAGVLESQVPEVIDAYKHQISVKQIDSMDGWSILGGQKL